MTSRRWLLPHFRRPRQDDRIGSASPPARIRSRPAGREHDDPYSKKHPLGFHLAARMSSSPVEAPVSSCRQRRPVSSLQLRNPHATIHFLVDDDSPPDALFRCRSHRRRHRTRPGLGRHRHAQRAAVGARHHPATGAGRRRPRPAGGDAGEAAPSGPRRDRRRAGAGDRRHRQRRRRSTGIAALDRRRAGRPRRVRHPLVQRPGRHAQLQALPAEHLPRRRAPPTGCRWS